MLSKSTFASNIPDHSPRNYRCLKLVQTGKSCGEDGISFEFMSALVKSDLAQHFADVLNSILFGTPLLVSGSNLASPSFPKSRALHCLNIFVLLFSRPPQVKSSPKSGFPPSLSTPGRQSTSL